MRVRVEHAPFCDHLDWGRRPFSPNTLAEKLPLRVRIALNRKRCLVNRPIVNEMDISQLTSDPNIVYVAAGTVLVIILTIGKHYSYAPTHHTKVAHTFLMFH